MRIWAMVTGLVLAFLGGEAYLCYMVFFKVPAGSPSEFAALPGGLPAQKPGTLRVACIGDSLTHATVSHDWVGDLQAGALGHLGFTFINAGWTGNLAWNIDQRLDAVLALKPDVATLLIGTNDVMGTFDEKDGRMYIHMQGIPQLPTLDFFKDNMRRVLTRLRDAQPPLKRRAVCTLPPLGEKEGDAPNQLVAKFNAVIRELAAETGTTVLPLNEKLWELIRVSRMRPSVDGYLGGAPKAWSIVRTVHWHYLAGRSWDDCAKAEGRAVLFDNIHFSSNGASVLRELVEKFVREAL